MTLPVEPNFPQDAVAAGQAVYSRRVLAWYDWLVLGLSNRWLWRCPSSRLIELYSRNITGVHLEVGVGTGYFLDRCTYPVGVPKLMLADLNRNCLEFTSRRLARYSPTRLLHNAFDPLPADLHGQFTSIGVNYLLHCLPGTMSDKAVVFQHLSRGLTPFGVLFGSTILGTGVPMSGMARRLMRTYNRKRIFSNDTDDLAGLQAALDASFSLVTIDTIGCVARFVARRPRWAGE